MDYYRLLNLKKEPFSNSPDPDFFFQSAQHRTCLQRLEIAIRLRRGLNVVIGEVGTGKTTLCRHLIRKFAREEGTDTHLILDPYFSKPIHFLSALTQTFGLQGAEERSDPWTIKERIKHHLFGRGVDEGKTIVLIIDEGQKLPVFCLEMLRELLNYETNEFKLLQIVIFAQGEFRSTLRDLSNFTDRINLSIDLGPLGFSDTRAMIRFRLDCAADDASLPVPSFSLPALWEVYRATSGYPRKIINLCHPSLIGMIVQNRSQVTWALVRSCRKRGMADRRGSWPKAAGWGTFALFWGIVSLFGLKGAFTPMSDAVVDSPSVVAGRTAAEVLPPVERKVPEVPEGSTIIAEEPPETTEPMDPVAPEMPAMLGEAAVEPGETFGGLVHDVYGTASPEQIKAVLSANPHIENPNRLSIGQAIRFPAIPVEGRPNVPSGFWIEVGQEKDFEAALGEVRSEDDGLLKTRIISHWHRTRGLSFSIVLDRTYSDRSEAEKDLALVSTDGTGRSRLIEKWPGNTVFFSRLL